MAQPVQDMVPSLVAPWVAQPAVDRVPTWVAPWVAQPVVGRGPSLVARQGVHKDPRASSAVLELELLEVASQSSLPA